ncbi:C39 family peptidase [Dactylosporangium sp. CA-139066]|uniref:C39 family peptidase n=1 Tax=Dactylosporangium sp. CA-139066 TaxID=3239930 RepID=UPI003D91398B
MSYFYTSRHSQRTPSFVRRRLPVVAASACLAAAASFGVVALQQGSPTPADAQALVGAESSVDASSTSGGSTPGAAAGAARGKQPADAAPTKPSSPTSAAGSSSPSPSASQSATPPVQKDISYQFAWQENYYFCGPAATRIALTARGLFPSQSEVAQRLGTTESGTNSSEDTARALNAFTGTNFYEAHFIRGSTATPADVDELRSSVVSAISQGYAVVANIAGSTVDDAGHGHSYDGGHYLTIVGYRDGGATVKIADPADAQGVGSYTLPVTKMADWIAQRGYAA